METKANDALMDEAAAIIPEVFDGVVEGVIGLRFTDAGWRAPFIGNEGGVTSVYIADYSGGDIAIAPFTVTDPEVDKQLAKIAADADDTLPKPQPL